MICRSCGDKGIIRCPYTDNPDEDLFALCLCPTGQTMRTTRNAGKETGYALWQVWCAREQIDPSRMYLMEEVLTAQELAERGFQAPGKAQPQSREAALLAAGKTRKGKL